MGRLNFGLFVGVFRKNKSGRMIFFCLDKSHISRFSLIIFVAGLEKLDNPGVMENEEEGRHKHRLERLVEGLNLLIFSTAGEGGKVDDTLYEKLFEEIAKYLHHQSPLSLQTVLLEHGLLSLLSSTLLGPQPSLSSFPPRWWDLESEESNNYKALGVCLRLTGLVLACPGVGWMVSVSPKVVQEVVLGKRSLLQDHSEANNEGGEKRGICFFNALVHYLGHYEGGIGGKRKRGEEGSKRVVGIHPLAGVRDNAVRALYSLLLSDQKEHVREIIHLMVSLSPPSPPLSTSETTQTKDERGEELGIIPLLLLRATDVAHHVALNAIKLLSLSLSSSLSSSSSYTEKIVGEVMKWVEEQKKREEEEHKPQSNGINQDKKQEREKREALFLTPFQFEWKPTLVRFLSHLLPHLPSLPPPSSSFQKIENMFETTLNLVLPALFSTPDRLFLTRLYELLSLLTHPSSPFHSLLPVLVVSWWGGEGDGFSLSHLPSISLPSFHYSSHLLGVELLSFSFFCLSLPPSSQSFFLSSLSSNGRTEKGEGGKVGEGFGGLSQTELVLRGLKVIFSVKNCIFPKGREGNGTREWGGRVLSLLLYVCNSYFRGEGAGGGNGKGRKAGLLLEAPLLEFLGLREEERAGGEGGEGKEGRFGVVVEQIVKMIPSFLLFSFSPSVPGSVLEWERELAKEIIIFLQLGLEFSSSSSPSSLFPSFPLSSSPLPSPSPLSPLQQQRKSQLPPSFSLPLLKALRSLWSTLSSAPPPLLSPLLSGLSFQVSECARGVWGAGAGGGGGGEGNCVVFEQLRFISVVLGICVVGREHKRQGGEENGKEDGKTNDTNHYSHHPLFFSFFNSSPSSSLPAPPSPTSVPNPPTTELAFFLKRMVLNELAEIRETTLQFLTYLLSPSNSPLLSSPLSPNFSLSFPFPSPFPPFFENELIPTTPSSPLSLSTLRTLEFIHLFSKKRSGLLSDVASRLNDADGHVRSSSIRTLANLAQWEAGWDLLVGKKGEGEEREGVVGLLVGRGGDVNEFPRRAFVGLLCDLLRFPERLRGLLEEKEGEGGRCVREFFLDFVEDDDSDVRYGCLYFVWLLLGYCFPGGSSSQSSSAASSTSPNILFTTFTKWKQSTKTTKPLSLPPSQQQQLQHWYQEVFIGIGGPLFLLSTLLHDSSHRLTASTLSLLTTLHSLSLSPSSSPSSPQTVEWNDFLSFVSLFSSSFASSLPIPKWEGDVAEEVEELEFLGAIPEHVETTTDMSDGDRSDDDVVLDCY